MKTGIGLFRHAAGILLAGCFGLAAAVRAETEAEAVWGRVLGVYCQHDTKSGDPEFPFYSQKQINPASVSTSVNAATPDTSALDPAEVASLPSDAFTFTGYVSEENDAIFTTFKTPAVFTPGATYRMNVYLNEPFAANQRAQFVVVNGERVKDATGQDLVVDPSNVDFAGTQVAKKVWKFVVSNVVAQADGTISWGFPRSRNKSVMNVVTFDGTACPATPTLSAAANSSSVSLSWTPCADTLVYLVERQDATGAWTTIAQTRENSYVDTELAVKGNVYRVVASNGVGVATSNVLQSRRSLYALHLGPAGRVFGRFVPAGAFISGKFKPRTLPKNPVDVPPELVDCGDLPRFFSYFDSTLTFAFSNLTANAVHELRFWTVEPFEAISGIGDPDAYRRVAISVNGETVTNDVSAWALSGHVNHKPVPVDFKGTADAEGTLTVQLQPISDQGTCIGLELFALADVQEAAPPLKAYGSSEWVRLVADDRSAEANYDFQFRDPETDEPTDFLHDVPGWSVYDVSLATGQTREYRARVAHAVEPGPWSAWVQATRTDRSPYVPLRVNHTRNAEVMQNPPEGWVDGEQYRTSVHADSALNSTVYTSTDVSIDLSRVSDPAPEAVYRTQFFTSDDKDVRFAFPGFDPDREYKVRVHMMETWVAATVGTRRFALGIDGAIPSGYEVLDVYVAAGSNHNTAVVWELKTRPALDGTIRLDVFHNVQYATIRGTEIVPLGDSIHFDGLVKTAWYANSENADAVEEACAAETSHAGWSWTAADVPAVCAGTRTRLMARGRLIVPAEGVYAFQVAANGLARLWLDGSTNLVDETSASTSNPVSSPNVVLSAGVHELVFEYLQGEGADFAAAVAWTCSAGTLGDLKDYTSSVDVAPRLPTGWKIRQMGNRSVPSYGFIADSGTEACRLSGSGRDLWGATCDGTFLYRELTGLFEVKMRIRDRGGLYASNTRFGMMVCSTLGQLEDSDFLLYAGVNGDAEGGMTLRGYADVDFQAGTAIATWGLNTVPMATPNLPVWMKFTRESCPTGGHRYVCAFSTDDENWYFARTQDVRRVNSVFVGPWVTGHHTVDGTLAWMEFDGLSVVDTTPQGMMLFFR
ncbi:MAG: PA14 domain-containing protein [Kiritimatiellia bacterium]